MPRLTDVTCDDMPPAQAADLVRVLNLHAEWEAQRDTPAADARAATRRLQSLQGAFEAFRSQRAGYSSRYRTDQIPEVAPAGPDRLARWCRVVRTLLRRSGGADHSAALVGKAYRLADRIAVRTGAAPLVRVEGITTDAGAAGAFDEVVRWCEAQTVPAVGPA